MPERIRNVPSPEKGDSAIEAAQFVEHLTSDERDELSKLTSRYRELLTTAQERATAKDPVKALEGGYYKVPLGTGGES